MEISLSTGGIENKKTVKYGERKTMNRKGDI